jgi:DNA-binding Lrp family transcriptional regulator
MIQEELIAMNQKERDRLKVLHEAKERQITQKEAAGQIGVSERWVRKLMERMRREGDRAVVHGLRGRSSNRRIAAPIREQAVGWVKKE